MVSQEQFDNLLLHVQGQDDTIRALGEHLDAAARRMIELEKEKNKQSKHGRIHYGKDLCPDAYDRKDAAELKNWRLKVAKYLCSDEDDNGNRDPGLGRQAEGGDQESPVRREGRRRRLGRGRQVLKSLVQVPHG